MVQCYIRRYTMFFIWKLSFSVVNDCSFLFLFHASRSWIIYKLSMVCKS